MDMGLEYLFLKDKIQDFKELGRCEVSSIEHANLMTKILSTDEDITRFNMSYAICPMGEYWYFENK